MRAAVSCTVYAVIAAVMYHFAASEVVTEIGSSNMPYPGYLNAIYQQVIGYESSRNLIWLIGGRNYWNDYKSTLVSFNVSEWDESSPFINYGTPSFFGQRPRVQCGGQCSTTINDQVYFVNHYNNKGAKNGITTFNKYTLTEPQSYEPGWNGVTDSLGYYQSSCLLQMDDAYLIITGPNPESVGIYDIGNSAWIRNVPSMNVDRNYHSCALNGKTKTVYVFGGQSGSWPDTTNTIEKLDVSRLNRMKRKRWRLLGATISAPSMYHRAVFHKGLIYIIGTPAGVEVFDVNTETCSVYGELAVSVTAPAVIKVDPRIYIFGGFDSSTRAGTNDWQYINLNNAENAAESEILSAVSNNHKKNVSGISNIQLLLALVFGVTLVTLVSLTIGGCIGKKTDKTKHNYKYSSINDCEEAV